MPRGQLWQPRGTVYLNETMSKHTSFRTGGLAQRYYVPEDLDALTEFFQQSQDEVHWVGLGSNLLVRDGGLQGTVICPLGTLNKMSRLDDSCVRIEAGATGAAFVRFCISHHLSGMEFLGTIPGTLGGALAMNAGAYDSETWQFVTQLEMINRQGEIKIRSPKEFRVGYREVIKPHIDEWFIAAHFNLKCNEEGQGEKRMKELMARRMASQPVGEYCCGSVFRNPVNEFAAKLIDHCGLKGFCLRGACISEKHANFIVNQGQASASDIEKLIQYVIDVVMNRYKIRLIPEVCIIGLNK